MKKAVLLSFVSILFLVSLSFPVHSYPVDEYFWHILAAHGPVMLVIDPETGRIDYASQAAADFFGYPAEELAGMAVANIAAGSREELAAIMVAALTREEHHFTLQHRLASGETRTVELYAYPYLEGDREKLFTIVHDVTAESRLGAQNRALAIACFAALMAIIACLVFITHLREKNLAELRRRNEEINLFNELRRGFMNAIDGLIYLKDENLRYLFANKAMEEFYRLGEKEIVGRDDYDLGPAALAERIRKTDLEVLREQRLIVDQIEWGGRVLKTTKFPVRLVTGKYGVGAYIQDVTEEHARLRKEERRLLRNSILVEILGRNFSSTDEQLKHALDEALRLTESKYGYLHLYEEETGELTLLAWSRGAAEDCQLPDREVKHRLERAGLLGQVVARRQPLIVNDYQKGYPSKKELPPGHIPITRFLLVPVLIEDRVVAVLGLANKEEDYDQEVLHQVTVLMNMVWQAKERREAVDNLALERQKYFLTLLSIGDGVMVVDREGKIEILNEAAQKMTGWLDREAVGRHYREVFVLTHEEEGGQVQDPIAAALATERIQKLDNKAVLVSRDGKRYHLEDSAAPIKDSSGHTIGVVLVFRDVTAEKEQRKKIEYLSFRDPLTGLYNRRYVEEKLQELDSGENLPLSIIVGDINSLKLANDIFGHSYGDQLLQRTAEALRRVLRTGDIIARWGGDEFLVLLPHTGAREAEKIVARIKDEVGREYIRGIQGTISLGFATKEKVEQKVLQVIKQAEDAMYTEKSLGRAGNDRRMLGNLLVAFHKASPRESGHADRVARLCRNFGIKLGLAPRELERLVEAGFFHDLGKIVLDREVLNKVGVLTEQEWCQVKRHPVVGCRILKLFDETFDQADIVLSHHER